MYALEDKHIGAESVDEHGIGMNTISKTKEPQQGALRVSKIYYNAFFTSLNASCNLEASGPPACAISGLPPPP